MTRFDAFEIYLKPEKPREQPYRTHRERQFQHWLAEGYACDWAGCERLWQQYGLDKETA